MSRIVVAPRLATWSSFSTAPANVPASSGASSELTWPVKSGTLSSYTTSWPGKRRVERAVAERGAPDAGPKSPLGACIASPIEPMNAGGTVCRSANAPRGG